MSTLPPFPIDALPKSIRDPVWAVHLRTQAPLPLAASIALGAVSLACQHKHTVELFNGKISPTAIYLLNSAESGAGKSACETQFFEAIRASDAASRAVFQLKSAGYRAQSDIWAIKERAIGASIKSLMRRGESTIAREEELAELKLSRPPEISLQRHIYDDVTPAALIQSLPFSGANVGLVSDEAGKQFLGPAFREVTDYCRMWDGATIRVARVDAEPIFFDNPTLTICASIQPGLLKRAIERKSEVLCDSGFIPRFLFSMAEVLHGKRFMATRLQSSNLEVPIFHSRVAELLTEGKNKALRTTLKFSPGAYQDWSDAHDYIEQEMGEHHGLSDVREAATKMIDNISRIAANFHVFEGYGDDAISADTLRAASMVGMWYLGQFRKMFSLEAQIPQSITDAKTLFEWVMARTPPFAGYMDFGRSYLLNAGPGSLREKKRLDAALMCLAEQGHVLPQTFKVDGKQVIRFKTSKW